jgi:hypothetical protein
MQLKITKNTNAKRRIKKLVSIAKRSNIHLFQAQHAQKYRRVLLPHLLLLNCLLGPLKKQEKAHHQHALHF